MILRKQVSLLRNNLRTFKNFGHKQQPVPTVTFLWHGFLTFTFLGLFLDWERIGSFIFNKKKHENSPNPET